MTTPDPRGVEAVRALARASRLLERATGDLGMAQYRVLSAIGSGEARASRVARRFELGKPTVSAAVDALCREGLLERKEATDDQRAVELALTPAGRARLAATEAEMVRVLEDLCSRAGPGRPVLGALADLGRAIDEMQAERSAGDAAARATR